MKIQLPEPQTPDVFSLGFDNHLNREIERIDSPLVYNTVEERLSQLIQTSGVASNSTQGVPTSDVSTY